MAVVVATRLHAPGWRQWRTMTALSKAVTAQLREQPGLLGGRTAIDRHGVFWTVTAWRSGRDLAAWGRAHAAVSVRGPELSDDMDATRWQSADDGVPTWREVGERWPGRGVPRHALSRTLPADR